MQVYHRKNGEEQPYWPAGPFKIRLPFVHYRWEFAEMVQALIMFVVSLAMIPLLEKYLGVPYDVALAYVVVCGIGFMLPALLTGALNPLAPEQLGAGSSTINFTRQLGGAFGVNIVALTIEFGDHSGGIPTIGAFHSAWWLVAVFAAMAAIPVWKMRV